MAVEERGVERIEKKQQKCQFGHSDPQKSFLEKRTDSLYNRGQTQLFAHRIGRELDGNKFRSVSEHRLRSLSSAQESRRGGEEVERTIQHPIRRWRSNRRLCLRLSLNPPQRVQHLVVHDRRRGGGCRGVEGGKESKGERMKEVERRRRERNEDKGWRKRRNERAMAESTATSATSK